MQIKVYTIDVHFPRWLKRALVFGAIPAAVLLGTVHYLRADVTVPNIFSNGDTLSASRLNANFDALKTGIDAVATKAVPPGTIAAFGGQAAPNGWLLCDGSAVKRADYPGLFTAIGTTWGSGDGTTFNVPDLRGRNLFAASVAGTFATVGTTGGSEIHTHTEVAHSHTVTAHTHPIAADGNHTHVIRAATCWTPGGTAPFSCNQSMDAAGSHNHNNATDTASPGTDSQQPTINAASNLPPYAVVTYIIKW
jgi:microcystin-dependent protein